MSADIPEDPTDVVGRRVGGWIVDVALCLVVVTVGIALLGDTYTVDALDEDLMFEFVDGDAAVSVASTVFVLRGSELAVLGALALLVATLVFAILPGRWGWSPGNWAAAVRVVGPDDRPIGVGRGLLRAAAWIVDLIPGIPLVGYATMRFTTDHRRVGDLVAGARVVDRRALAGAPAPVDIAPEEPTAEEPTSEGAATATDIDVADTGPRPEAAPAAAATSAEKTASGGPEPIWDARWKRYLLWHPKRQIWLTHDDEQGRWVPLEEDRKAP